MDNNGWNDGQNQSGQNQYEQNQYNQNQYNQNQYDQNQYNQNQYNPNQYNQNQYGPNGYGQNGGRGGNGTGSSPMGITSMVLGILSIVLICCCYAMSIPLGIAAVVFGIVSMRKNEPQRGFAIAGIITGAIGFVCSVAMIIIVRYLVETGMYEKIMNEFYGEMGIDPKDMLR